MAEGLLATIEAAKRDELEARFQGVSLEALRQQARPTEGSLAAAIAKPGARFILEIKKASPSAGTIRADADVQAIARGYGGVADALSVLTDGKFFGGCTADLAAARGAFDGPILAKDFFIDSRQIVEARIAGADAILVMLSLLDNAQARAMIGEARKLGMDALVEVHDEKEMSRALALETTLIGINNRDLRDLSIDLGTTERLAGLAPDRLLVSESGITDRRDVKRLSAHVDGFLIGSSLMRAAHPPGAARELIFGRVKLCGLRTGTDIDAGRAATFAGLVFVPGTPRDLAVDEALPLAAVAHQASVLPVGVFRDAPVAQVAEIATALELHAVQLHGGEDADYVRALRAKLPEQCEVWTAIDATASPLKQRGGDRLLFDNGPGATGRMFDWDQVRNHADLRSAIVAGGIGPHNAREAAALGAYAMDVGSSLDAAPGLKSPEKIRAFFEALRAPTRDRMRLSKCA